jgi:epoxyqueuosine reductase
MPEHDHRTALEKIARQGGCTLFGVAGLHSFPTEAIHLPSPVKDRFSFGISIGFRLSDAVLETIQDEPTLLYFQHYQRTNILLDTLGLLLTSAIQELGFQALPVPASQIVDWKTQEAHLSHKHLARAAGLGWIGRNNLLVNEAYGSRIRLLTVLTDLPLQADAAADGECGSCRACLQVCPAKAIRDRQEDFDHLQCYEQLKRFSKTLHLSHNVCGICVRACAGRTKKPASSGCLGVR